MRIPSPPIAGVILFLFLCNPKFLSTMTSCQCRFIGSGVTFISTHPACISPNAGAMFTAVGDMPRNLNIQSGATYPKESAFLWRDQKNCQKRCFFGVSFDSRLSFFYLFTHLFVVRGWIEVG